MVEIRFEDSPNRVEVSIKLLNKTVAKAVWLVASDLGNVVTGDLRIEEVKSRPMRDGVGFYVNQVLNVCLAEWLSDGAIVAPAAFLNPAETPQVPNAGPERSGKSEAK